MITELEFTTPAHTILNIFVYAFWWNKPVNVRFPLDVYPIQKMEWNPGVKKKGDRDRTIPGCGLWKTAIGVAAVKAGSTRQIRRRGTGKRSRGPILAKLRLGYVHRSRGGQLWRHSLLCVECVLPDPHCFGKP